MRQSPSILQPLYLYQSVKNLLRHLYLANNMDLDALRHDYSFDTPDEPPSVRRQELETTPSKRRAPFMIHQTPSNARNHSVPNLPRSEQSVNDSLDIPNLPTPPKRAKSASGQSPGAVIAKDGRAIASPGPGTPGSCKKMANHYKELHWQTKHIDKCMDPTCKVRSSSLQRGSPSDKDKSSSKVPQQRVEDVFTSTPTKKPAALLRTISSTNVPSNTEGPQAGARGELDADEFDAIEEPHGKTAGSEETDDQEPEDPHEAQSDQDESVLENAVSAYDKSPLKMHNILQMKFEQGVSSNDGSGSIYVMRDVNRPHLCKIGRSIDPKVRLGTMKRRCGLELEILHCKPVNFYTKAEALVHAYLLDLCKPYKCELCKQRHGEWFEIPSDLAKAAVDKWADFIDHERPYDSRSRHLRPCWSAWLHQPYFTFADASVDDLRRQWDKFMSRSQFNHLSFEMKSIWEIAWMFFWPVYATSAWTVTFIAFRHPVVFLLMATSVIGTFVSMTSDIHLQRRATATSKQRKAT